MKNAFHVMLIPTLGCPAHCSYCWSSEEGSPIMSIDTVREVVEWLKDFRKEPVTFTFHGGEPLLAGADFYREALPLLAEGLEHLNPSFALQTNLWKMTPELADILAAYGIPIGSSIDGPQEINDVQRGEGYYEKTMRGYETAVSHGLYVSFICTFTSYSVAFKEEIFDFFLKNGLPLKLHPALPSLRDNSPEQWALDPEEYGELLVYLLDKSLEYLGRIEIKNINDLCKSVFTRHGTVCTFADCMGNTFAVGPDGGIYPCYRFVGMPEYRMGSVYNHPSPEDLARSDAGRLMQQYKEYVDTACAGCRHIRYCRGGCPYNAIAPTGGEINGVDPMCPAYRRAFDEIADRLNTEMSGTSFMERFSLHSGPAKESRPGIMDLMRVMILR
ncbi:MAG TPA: TIGR04083 family peptide-modifying radical SAM enzyme [Methanomicrobiales archaeon]|nr:TIGR04083 family peptide-modifying radical SAM enzyme [Methanomicrobiales archaeon]